MTSESPRRFHGVVEEHSADVQCVRVGELLELCLIQANFQCIPDQGVAVTYEEVSIEWNCNLVLIII